MVIMSHEGIGSQKAAEIRLRLHAEFPMDLMVRAPENIRERIDMNDFFMQEVIEKGRVLYEADRP